MSVYVPTQDYQQLANIKKKFEPYFQLWDTADQWLTASAQWHSSSFVSLEAEQIEQDVSTYKNAIQKAFKFFDRNNLSDQSAIAKEIKDQVKSFEPYVPIIVALRNQGMRPRHWRQVGSALGLEDFEPSDDFTLTKLLELDPASQEELITKVRASVPCYFLTAVRLTMTWVVSCPISRGFGPTS